MRRPLLSAGLAAALCALLAACGSSSSTSAAGSAGSTSASSSAAAASSTTAATATVGFESVPLEQGPSLAPASTTGTGTVDGISCGATEQLAYHIHAHLAVFDDGRLYAIPPGVGIPGSTPQATQYGPVAGSGQCIYWLHTHTSDGIIHIESPTKRIYTLGNFFDVWHQPLTGHRIASLHGRVAAFVNGKAWRTDPRAIPLLPHADIQLEIGEPAPPLVTVNWSSTQL